MKHILFIASAILAAAGSACLVQSLLIGEALDALTGFGLLFWAVIAYRRAYRDSPPAERSGF